MPPKHTQIILFPSKGHIWPHMSKIIIVSRVSIGGADSKILTFFQLTLTSQKFCCQYNLPALSTTTDKGILKLNTGTKTQNHVILCVITDRIVLSRYGERVILLMITAPKHKTYIWLIIVKHEGHATHTHTITSIW